MEFEVWYNEKMDIMAASHLAFKSIIKADPNVFRFFVWEVEGKERFIVLNEDIIKEHGWIYICDL